MEWCSKWKTNKWVEKASLICSFPKTTKTSENQIQRSTLLLSTEMGYCPAHQNTFSKQTDHNQRINGQCWKEQAKSTNLKSQFTFLEIAITRGLSTSGLDDPTNPITVCGYAMDGDSSFSVSNRKESAWRSTFNSWVGKSPREGNANLLQHFYLENSMDRRAWRATIHGVAEGQTQLSD